jgi:hypothetical protein
MTGCAQPGGLINDYARLALDGDGGLWRHDGGVNRRGRCEAINDRPCWAAITRS